MSGQCGLRNYLRHAYGEHSTNVVTTFISLVRKKANLINQQYFLHNCKMNRILPKSMRPSLHLNTRNERQFTERIGFGILNHVISDCKSKRYRLNQDIFRLEREILCTLSYADFHQIKAIAENSFQHDFRISRQRLSEKLHRLKLEKLSNNPPFVPNASVSYTHLTLPTICSV